MCILLLHYVEQIQSYEISNFEKHAKISMLTRRVFTETVTIMYVSMYVCIYVCSTKLKYRTTGYIRVIIDYNFL